jgi:hypothetical protein
MGLENMLTTAGSNLSRANGGTIPTPVGATDQSKLQDEYSINGNPNIPFNGYFTNYQTKPQPSELDAANGNKPTSPLTAREPHLGMGFSNGTYPVSGPVGGNY